MRRTNAGPLADPAERPGLRLSLRARVLLLVFLINGVLFAAGGAFVLGLQLRSNRELEREFSEHLLYTLRTTIRPDADVHVAHILQWPNWALIEDAILVDRYEGGVAINPVGRVGRGAGFERGPVVEALGRAIATGRPVDDVVGGRAIPIEGPGGVWGACWYRMGIRVDRGALLVQLGTWFLASTLVLTAGTFLALRRLVLEPVEQLADGARRVRGGELAFRLREPSRRDELADLVRGFNAMTDEVQGAGERLAREVERATDKARRAEHAAMTQRRLAAMGELAAGIAHEINNPLGGLQNAAERLRDPALPEGKRAEYLALLERGLARIGGTVQKLLRFTPRGVETAPVDLRDVARDAVDLVRHRAERSGVALAVEEEGGAPPVVRGARNELGQAVLNLLANALDALEEGGTADPGGPRVVVRVGLRGGEAVVEVADNGPGVDEQALGRVSDLFYTTKAVGKGTGLGLALVHNTAAGHGGRLSLASTPGRGFTAELRLPREGAGA